MDTYLKDLTSAHPFLLIDFHATWCEPCKWVEPLLYDVENHFEGKVVLHKIDIDEHPDVAHDLHILSVPTIVLFRSGEEVWRIRGFDTLPHMIKAINEQIQ
jgi:thioredoxin 1